MSFIPRPVALGVEISEDPYIRDMWGDPLARKDSKNIEKELQKQIWLSRGRPRSYEYENLKNLLGSLMLDKTSVCIHGEQAYKNLCKLVKSDESFNTFYKIKKNEIVGKNGSVLVLNTPSEMKKNIEVVWIEEQQRLDGGADGTRTRDPRRDRPVF